MRSCKRAPDVSVSDVLVSEMVKTTIFMGTKSKHESIETMN